MAHLFMNFKAHLKHTVSLCVFHKKINRDQPRNHEENCGPPPIWFILGLSRCLEVQFSSVHMELQAPWECIAIIPFRNKILWPREECFLVQYVCINPKTKAKDL
ncbi:hypothetical protein AMECASPLE_027741 [Ameca splendens]|uniref:Uncharacterized protein n=1 Tax=Ameca splendens TaxID=208324 RepID=A0ABV1ACH3_9TELE